MESNRIEQPSGTMLPEMSPDRLDPRLAEMLRFALAAIAQEQKLKDGAAPAEPKKEEKKEKKPEEQIPLFWKLCSAALVSVTALITVTLYNQLNAGAGQVRTDLGTVRSEMQQIRNDLVTKEEFNSQNRQTIDNVKQFQVNHKTREKLEDKHAEKQEKAIARLEFEIQRLREKLAILEDRYREAGLNPAVAEPASKSKKSDR